MSSLIPGYNYDIFISYRQKDNKVDGWVTEFVDILKRELDSMFKDEVSVYFDINPSDYLLESYDVDASLQDKLKCLIFIPIISRTYCDPKSFAWDNELKAFVNIASKDKFGFKIKLPNGNVSNRVLPIRIHDLDVADTKLFESVVGGFMRSIDFVYKETGVNRQLRAKDDDIIRSTGQVLYRDQINKVALTVKEIIESMKVTVSIDKAKQKEIQGRKIEEKTDNKVEEPAKEVTSKSKKEIQTDKIKKGINITAIKSPRIFIPVILLTIAILLLTTFLLNRHSKIKWAEEKALAEIEKLYNEDNMIAAFNLVQKANRYISEDMKLKEWTSIIINKLTILTDPPDADVFIRNYSDTVGTWTKLGKTPIDSVEMPANTFYRVGIEKTGYENVQGVVFTNNDTLFRKLFKQEEIPPEMVYVEGYKEEEAGNFLKAQNGFFMDQHEVTNKQFKKFIADGGYKKPEYWKNEFIKDGKKLTHEGAMIYFTDKTGRPGPTDWEAGDYPDGQDEYPVSGISWYEAAAYAEYAGKSLPTAEHWGSGIGFYIPNINVIFGSKIIPLSNFKGYGPVPAGKSQGISCYGAYDMAGNVKEWCWNETPVGHIIRGGAWNEPTYMYSDMSQLPSFDRSSKNGFRCVKYIGKEKIPESAFQLIKNIEGWYGYSGDRDFSKETPVEDKIFEIYKNQFLYDKTELNDKIEKTDSSNNDWTIEKITFNAAYGKERIIAYLFLPRNASPPYQTLMYWPGLNATFEDSLIKSDWKGSIDFILESGRAVMYPVYYRTFERKDGPLPIKEHQIADWIIKDCKDFRRSIDYLETRTDIDIDRLGYYGTSWGASEGPMTSIEDRIKVNILIVGGFNRLVLPEIDAINYVSRVKIPTLMLNGKYDYRYNIDINVTPFYRLLGTPAKDKILKVYETDHYVPRSEKIKETLNWLDKYFGPVNYLNDKE